MVRLQVEFAGIFLTPESRAALLAAHPPAHAKVFADHATLSFRPSPAQLPRGRRRKRRGQTRIR